MGRTTKNGTGRQNTPCYSQESVPLIPISFTNLYICLWQTLDALPSHLLTPFNGPVPPSNLLDKIARGVSHAKGPNEWPHSIRATRAKLLELARIRAKEAAEEKRTKSIAEEEDDDYSSGYFGDIVLQPTTNTPASPRKPLYRRSSMDFIASAKLDLKDNDNLSRYVVVYPCGIARN
jgi:hypothetical protein